MIDLISTHDNIEENTRTAAHLVAAIIAMAIQDICIVPTDEEMRHKCNLNTNAIQSLKFFFNPNSPFKAYAFLIGLEPNSFRRALETRQYEHETESRKKAPNLKHNDVKAMRMRIHWWQKNPVQSNQLELSI